MYNYTLMDGCKTIGFFSLFGWDVCIHCISLQIYLQDLITRYSYSVITNFYNNLMSVTSK